MRGGARRILRVIEAQDVAGFLGLALLTAGTALLSVPAALIVCGAILLALAVGGAAWSVWKRERR